LKMMKMREIMEITNKKMVSLAVFLKLHYEVGMKSFPPSDLTKHRKWYFLWDLFCPLSL